MWFLEHISRAAMAYNWKAQRAKWEGMFSMALRKVWTYVRHDWSASRSAFVLFLRGLSESRRGGNQRQLAQFLIFNLILIGS